MTNKTIYVPFFGMYIEFPILSSFITSIRSRHFFSFFFEKGLSLTCETKGRLSLVLMQNTL
jgi:hypothetical protein